MVKCTCNNCSTHLEFDESQSGQTVQCPSCGLDTVLFIPAEPAKKRSETHAPSILPGGFDAATTIPALMGQGSASATSSLSPWDHLVFIRGRTCYKALRSVIYFAFGLWAAISALILVSGIVMWLTGDGGVSDALIGVIGGLISGILCAAAWQASILLIDVADVLIQSTMPGSRG